jgi:hypothetical protein
LSQGPFILGTFCPGPFVRGLFVRGPSVQGPFVLLGHFVRGRIVLLHALNATEKEITLFLFISPSIKKVHNYDFLAAVRKTNDTEATPNQKWNLRRFKR